MSASRSGGGSDAEKAYAIELVPDRRGDSRQDTRQAAARHRERKRRRNSGIREGENLHARFGRRKEPA
jgi:hypothetical protein